jgi:hypothetical protein
MIFYGIMIAYTYVRIPNSKKKTSGIAHFSYRGTFKILENIPQGQEGFFSGKVLKMMFKGLC